MATQSEVRATTASKAEVALMAHLLRRAGFGATRDQLDAYLAKGYVATVEELLHPKYGVPEDQDLLDRYFIASVEARAPGHADPQWTWRLATSSQPLEEKIALFWHGLLAVGGVKLDHGLEMLREIDLFRKYGLGRFEDLLLAISRDPGMMYWLDNQNSHRDAPNENYGRELLELFSMGIDESGKGAYTEDDVKAAARAFTGWRSEATPPPFFLGPFDMRFTYDPSDHDDSEKTFLGQKGRFNGEDIVHLICQQRATAEFVAKRLYLFFVSDEPDWAEITRLADVFQANDGEIRAVLREIFNSDHFKSEEVRFRKVKGPAELIIGAVRLSQRFQLPELDSATLGPQIMLAGQHLLNPPSVEGWHEGEEWVDSGGLVERINFAANEMARSDAPGVRRMLDRVTSQWELEPESFVDACLDALGAIEVSKPTKVALVDHARRLGVLRPQDRNSRDRACEMLQLIVSTPDFQYC